ncbi:ABC transporter substrate-binding protein [Natronoglycomyces albus]|uniref:Solute-binding protein family 5 domain-containing protein n=1 Tax=Natronoglycomyces albus TaxID=2811108 RepID=A0A895XMU3_9ACTN|nr:ABC transporter substrate-binding protein [Natronoglycomyces albus]QSB05092.1 hypothetical protein JQS30_15235 [Natronoglycomyces albus]
MTSQRKTSRSMEMSRRRLLQAAGMGTVGVAGASALGACAADSSSNGEGGGTFVGSYDFDVTASHFNAFADDNALLLDSVYSELFTPRGALRVWGTGEWELQLIESYELGDDHSLEIKIRPGVEWTDGTEVTSKDFEGTYYLAKLTSAPDDIGYPDVEEIHVADDYTLHVQFRNSFDGIEYNVMRERILPHSRFGEFMDRAKELVLDGVSFGDDEEQDLTGEISTLEFQDEGYLTCGPFKIEPSDISDNIVVMKKHDKGLFTDQVKFDEVRIQKADNATAAQLLLEREIDYATHVLNPSDRDVVAGVEGLKQLPMAASPDGVGVMLNWGRHEEFQDVRVRQALMHVINREEVGIIAQGEDGSYPTQYVTGLADGIAERLFTSEELEDFNHYEHDTDQATALLEDAGWTLDGDNWLKPNGDRASYELIGVSGWDDFVQSATQIGEQLNNFGFDIEVLNVPEDNPWGIWGTGDFDMAIRQWGNPFNPDYWGAWQMGWYVDNERTGTNPGMGVPTDDVDDQYEIARDSFDEEEREEANRELAREFNETLPRLPVWGFVRLTHGIEGVRVKSLDFPSEWAENHPHEDNPVMMGILSGDIEPA